MTADYHNSRFAPDPRRQQVWRALWRHHFSKHVRPDDTVLDLGAGYGDFINSVTARRRIAIDIWDEMPRHVALGVETIVGEAHAMAGLADGSVDYAFASNLFEHLTQDELARVLSALGRALSPRGTLTILQPNYRYAYREYFDDYTHKTVYSHVTLADFLTAHGWQVTDVRPRFLPLTVKSRLPVFDLLIRAYLSSPIRPLAKQMLVVARPPGSR